MSFISEKHREIDIFSFRKQSLDSKFLAGASFPDTKNFHTHPYNG